MLVVAFALGAVACTALVSLDGLTGGGSGTDAGPSPALEAGGIDSGDGGADAASLDAASDALRPYVEEVRADAPVAYWRLGETGGDAKDEQAKFPGQYMGAGDVGVAGAIRGDTNTAADFQGGTISFADAFGFEGRAAFSVEMWVMPAVVDDNYRHFYRKVTSGALRTGHLMWVQTEGYAFERNVNQADDGGGVQDAVIRPAGLPVGAWSYIVATYDGTTMRTYVNGVEAGMASSTASLTATGTAFVLGEGYLGKMDEVAIYPRALPADRIRTHYKAAGY